MSNKARVLIGSPIRQSPLILNRFLESLEALDKKLIEVDYYFIDDNENIESGKLLREFGKDIESSIFIEESNFNDVYIKNETTHFWDDNLIWKVAAFKNRIIKYCIDKGYDYLFLIDSDLVLAPQTLEHLISTGKHIISEVYWTKWQPNTDSMPQVWLFDQYSFSDKSSVLESAMKYLEFREKLRVPGIYKVGGLGACTLIDREALEKGVSFEKIYNISMVGEDRHFCIRAAALGLELYVDTSYPAFHIYRDEYLDRVEDYIYTYKNFKVPPSSLLDEGSFVLEFLRLFYTYDCSEKPYLSGINLLSEDCQGMINEKKSDIIKYLSENKIVCSIENCKIINITEESGAHIVNTLFLLMLKKDDITIEKNIYCNVTLLKDYETIWKVYKVALMDSDKNTLLGFNIMDIIKLKPTAL